MKKEKYRIKFMYVYVFFFTLSAIGINVINYLNGYELNDVMFGLMALLIGVAILYRVKIKKFGFLFLTAIIYSMLALGSDCFLHIKLYDTEFILLVKIFVCVCTILLLLDIVIYIVRPSQVILRPYKGKEIIAIITGSAALSIVTRAMFGFGNSIFIILSTVFIIAMFLMFLILLVDKFGTLTLSMAISSGFTYLLFNGAMRTNYFKGNNVFTVIFISFIIGLIVECVLVSNCYKNMKYVVNGVRYGFINNSYFVRIQGIMAAIIASFMVPSLYIFFFLDKTSMDTFCVNFSMASLWALLGSITVVFCTFSIKEWPIYKMIHGDMELIWKREMPKWIPCCSIADIDNDGKNEIIVGCADNYMYCLKDGAVLWKTFVKNVPSPVIGVGKVGKDDEIKIVIGSYEGDVVCLNAKGEQLWSVNIGYWVWAVILGDVDNDGENEVIAGGMEDVVHVYKDGGTELWNTDFDSWVGCFAVGDVDGDGRNELIAGSNDQTLRCFKDGPNEVWRAVFGEWVNCCAVGDVDNDGKDEVIGGSNDGTVRCYKNGKEVWRIDNIPGGPGAITVGDVDNDGKNEIVLGCGDHTLRVIKDGIEVLVARLDRYPDCVCIGDTDNDGKNELLTGDWYSYLRCFRI